MRVGAGCAMEGRRDTGQDMQGEISLRENFLRDQIEILFLTS
jgi:hypothetical protein